jgi:hypothetical protein
MGIVETLLPIALPPCRLIYVESSTRIERDTLLIRNIMKTFRGGEKAEKQA